MKRKSNLYENIYKMENIQAAFNEVCKNTKNKRKVDNYKQYKCIYISRIYNILKDKSYKVGPYNIFTIYEPKERRIVSQNLQDKIVNHLVSRYILYPALMSCLIPENIASIKDRGTKEGLRLAKLYHQKCKIKYGTYYILKCDISKFFASIDKEILKTKLQKKIKDKDALDIVYKIIDSEENGLGIGNMTSQVLAVFYLNDLDYYIKEDLKIKYYVRYQDDFLLFHESKDYLKKCFLFIQKFLEKEHLVLNRKSRLYKSTNHFIFLGRDVSGKYAKYRTVKRKLKYRKYLYETGKISFSSYLSSHMAYKNFRKKDA
ncbi:MAG: RNA-directed DNA polymerase [Clostridia bacterium]|nr:RNA-directed DNA polymerase [Clostridia bacterium]